MPVLRSLLLIIDDFGLKPLAPPQDDDFHELISDRQTKGAETDRPLLNHRATSRLYILVSEE